MSPPACGPGAAPFGCAPNGFAGAAIGAVGTLVFQDRDVGFALGTAAGLATNKIVVNASLGAALAHVGVAA